ncbi:MAG: glycosyltransferase family 2 protein [Dethiobacter sp.]|nr:glycosyltransferase family 2 protein [Dethiobacter sp.]
MYSICKVRREKLTATITVLLPSFNGGSYLAEALASVFQQTYPSWQVIVIDDASTDNSISAAKDYLADHRVTLITNQQNLGQSKSLNKGLALVRTPYAIQLDSDDWFHSNTLALLHTAAEQLPEKVALISGNLQLVIQSHDGRIINGEIWRNRSFSDRYDFMLADCSQWPRFYRTSALRNVGGWPIADPYEGRYMEDKQILFRLIENHEFYWLDQTMYYHRRHSGNQTNLKQIYNELTEWVIRDTLKRWGNRYEPVFKDDIFGRKRLLRLNPSPSTTFPSPSSSSPLPLGEG